MTGHHPIESGPTRPARRSVARRRAMLVAVSIGCLAVTVGCSGSDTRVESAPTTAAPATTAAVPTHGKDRVCQLLRPVLDRDGRWAPLKATDERLATLLPKVERLLPPQQQKNVAEILATHGTTPPTADVPNGTTRASPADRARYEFGSWLTQRCSSAPK